VRADHFIAHPQTLRGALIYLGSANYIPVST